MTVRRTKLVPEVYDLGSLWLYRDDLRTITAAVRELDEVEITCVSGGNDNYEASDPSDFDQLPESLESVRISTKRSSSAAVTVMIDTGRATVQLVEPDIPADGVLSRIRAICEPRRRPGWSFCHWAGPTLAILILAYLVVSTIAYNLTKTSPFWNNAFWTPEILVLSVALLAAGGGIMVIGSNKRKVRITNAMRADRPRYWARTRDMWVVGVATAIAGAVLGYLLGRIT
jgi:hypothetical protein